jgi:chromosome segregation ATPase
VLVDVDLELVREAQRQTQAHAQGLAETRELLAHRDAEVQRRDEDIAILGAAVRDLEARAAQLQELLAAKEEALRSALGAREQSDRNCLAARAETERLRSSLGMRLLGRYQAALDQAAPIGSRRRRAYMSARRIVEPGATAPQGQEAPAAGSRT